MEKYHAVFHNLALPAILIDEHNRVADLNRMARDVFCDNEAGSCETTIENEIIRWLEEDITHLRTTGHLSSEFKKNYPSGTEDSHFHVRISAIHPDRPEGHLLIMLTDVTRAELHVREIERIGTIVHSATAGMLIISPKGIVKTWNPAATKIFGHSAEGMVGAKLSKILPPGWPNRLYKILRRLESGESFPDIEVEWRRKNKSLIPLSVSFSAIKDDQGRFVEAALVLRDITIQKNMEKELLSSKKIAEEANRAKSEFLARMSHEIRTPMNIILGMTDLALNTSIKGETKDYLSSVRDAAGHLLEIINDILDISKIEARELRLNANDFNLHQTLGSTVKTLSLQARDKGIALHLGIHQNTPKWVCGDLARLRQIIINLVGNAIKFTEKGHIQVEVAPLPLAGNGGPNGKVGLQFTVRDTGIGIPEQLHESIFESFQQADNSSTRSQGGTGLGLAICKQLVEFMGGSIRLRSVQGQGSEFVFTAFFAPGSPTAPSPEEPPRAPAKFVSGPPLHILVVEDNLLNLKVAKDFLERSGHVVHSACHGNEALARIASQRFDLVLMDVEMPVMDGLEATRRLRAGDAGEWGRTVPVIAMTAHALSGSRHQCIEAGMDDYIAKPVDFPLLLAIIKRLAPRGHEDPSMLADAPEAGALLNTPAALDRLDGDKGLLAQLQSAFILDTAGKLASLELFIKDKDIEQAVRTAHSLKGICGVIGAETCIRLASKVEQSVRQERLGQAATDLSRLQEEMETVHGLLRNTEPAPSSPGIMPKPRTGKRILLVDDDPQSLHVLEGVTLSLGHSPVMAASGSQALKLMDKSIDLVVLDVLMPELDGYAVTRAIRQRPDVGDVPIIIQTILEGREERVRAMEAGANDFVNKPLDATELKARINSQLKIRTYQEDLKTHHEDIRIIVESRTATLRNALSNLRLSQQQSSSEYLETLYLLASTVDCRGKGSMEHIHRVSCYCALIGRHLEMSKDQVDLLYKASPLHDIGQVGVPDHILLKPGPLTALEREEMKRHTLYGKDLLKGGSTTVLNMARDIALTHHEHWDGQGYPQGLSGDLIPLPGRICALGDVFDALTNDRPYRKALSPDQAFEIMREERGRKFDPVLFDIFQSSFDEILSIKNIDQHNSTVTTN